jgi:hypothetical protein
MMRARSDISFPQGRVVFIGAGTLVADFRGSHPQH